MAYKRKTEDEYQLVYDYGFGDGLEVLTRCSSLAECKRDKQAYIENEGIYPAIRRKRVPIYGQKASQKSW